MALATFPAADAEVVTVVLTPATYERAEALSEHRCMALETWIVALIRREIRRDDDRGAKRENDDPKS